MAYMWRYNPAIAEMLRLAKLGAFGDIFYYRGHIPKPIGWHPQLAQEFKVYHGGDLLRDGRTSDRPDGYPDGRTEGGAARFGTTLRQPI